MISYKVVLNQIEERDETKRGSLAMLDTEKLPAELRRWCELHAEMYPGTTQLILDTVVSVPELEKVQNFLDIVSAQMIENGRDFTPEEMERKSSTETERVIAIAYLAERQELS